MANDENLKAGTDTQFGGVRGNKRGGDKAWSIRTQIRYIAAQNIDLTEPDALKKIFGDNPTVAQRAAFKALLKAVKDDADIRAIEFADDRIDGKLPQTTINADWEDLKQKSDDELLSIITHGFTEIAAAGGGRHGSEAPGPEDQAAGEADTAGAAPEVPGPVDAEPA